MEKHQTTLPPTVKVSGARKTSFKASQEKTGPACSLLLERMNEGALALDLDGHVLYSNRRFCEMVGRTAEEVAGSQFCDFVAPESQPLCQQLKVQVSHREGRAELDLQRKDGSRMPVLTSVSRIEIENGPLVVAVVTDLRLQRGLAQALREANERLEDRVQERTAALEDMNLELQEEVRERRRVAAALRESREWFQQLTENVDLAFWIKERSTEKLHYMSPAIEPMLGCPRETLMRRFCAYLEYVHPEDRARVEAAHRRVAGLSQDTNPLFEEEFRVVRPDGTQRWLHTRAFPVNSGTDAPHRIAGIIQDVTERRESEEQLRRYSELLEELVEERTRQVRNLERHRVVVEQMAASGRMAARVAHEINNPLAGIKNAFLLLKDLIPCEHPYARYVPRIEREIDRIAAIVRQMFELCRPADECDEPIAVGTVVRETAAILELACGKRSLTLEVNIEEACASEALPGHALRQILHSLIQNAVDVSPPGARIEVQGTRCGDAVRLSVRDEGPGIPDDRQPYIFQPFYTTKSAHRDSGLGLGLSICRALVDSLGGRLTFATAAGVGTTFTVELPLERVACNSQ